MIAFAAVGVLYFNLVFSHFSRWIILALMILFLLMKSKLFLSINSECGAAILLFLGWCFLTIFWSEVPALSFYKATAYAMSVIGLTSAGIWWARSRPYDHALDIFIPISLLTIAAAVLGLWVHGSVIDAGSISLYQGLSRNPNLMGILAIMTWPVALCAVENVRGKRKIGFFEYSFLTAVLGLVLATSSRASIGAIVIATAVYLFGAGFLRYGVLLLVALLLGLIIHLNNPELFESAQKRFLYKDDRALRFEDIFKSREKIWEVSRRKAEDGGFVGVGFGIAAGHREQSDFSAFQGTRGREKGNTVLAVMEETGKVGLVLYAFVIYFVIGTPLRAALTTQDNKFRVMLCIVIGTLLGLVFNSQFEAWWIAAGGVATPYFWCMAGVGIGLAQKIHLRKSSPDFYRSAAGIV
ncbi:MAG: hypothetical protein JJ956_02745 [Pseudomonadales bacterium]|nr:hypothetical protein [Pseudomonadales bacterium]